VNHPPPQGGIFIPIRDDFGDITTRGVYLLAPSKAIIDRMNDVAPAIWELIRKGDLINPKDDVETFEHDLNKLVKRVFTK